VHRTLPEDPEMSLCGGHKSIREEEEGALCWDFHQRRWEERERREKGKRDRELNIMLALLPSESGGRVLGESEDGVVIGGLNPISRMDIYKLVPSYWLVFFHY